MRDKLHRCRNLEYLQEAISVRYLELLTKKPKNPLGSKKKKSYPATICHRETGAIHDCIDVITSSATDM